MKSTACCGSASGSPSANIEGRRRIPHAAGENEEPICEISRHRDSRAQVQREESDHPPDSRNARPMTISIDTNIFVAFWKTDGALNYLALSALDESHKHSNLAGTPPVF